RADALSGLRAVYFPVLHRLAIVLDNGVHAESCRRDHESYPPRLCPDPV
ncbi:hypothetical protein A2U01_0113630, partial [Trifolium medium]|nr:hypothetical protein [Trifolium medium]